MRFVVVIGGRSSWCTVFYETDIQKSCYILFSFYMVVLLIFMLRYSGMWLQRKRQRPVEGCSAFCRAPSMGAISRVKVPNRPAGGNG